MGVFIRPCLRGGGRPGRALPGGGRASGRVSRCSGRDMISASPCVPGPGDCRASGAARQPGMSPRITVQPAGALASGIKGQPRPPGTGRPPGSCAAGPGGCLAALPARSRRTRRGQRQLREGQEDAGARLSPACEQARVRMQDRMNAVWPIPIRNINIQPRRGRRLPAARSPLDYSRRNSTHYRFHRESHPYLDDRHHHRCGRRDPGVARDGRSRGRRSQALLLSAAIRLATATAAGGCPATSGARPCHSPRRVSAGTSTAAPPG